MIFREDKSTSKNQEVVRDKELGKLEFNSNNESNGSDGSTKSKEEAELQTLVIRRFVQVREQPKRYSTPKSFLAF